jgi:hypothetical protein
MEPTTYVYSKFYGWLGMIFLGGALLGFLYLGITDQGYKTWLSLSPLFLLTGAFIVYWSERCFIPALHNAIALELDDEKLHCYITNRTIYWRDVVEISEDYSQYSSFIKFEMVDGSNYLTVPTKWIAGSNTSIYNKMQKYFARTL